MRLPSIGGLANALGLGVQGYGQDVATNLQRERQRLQDQQSQQKFGLEQDLGRAQIGNYASEAAKRTADTTNTNALTAGKLAANQKAYGMIKKMSPAHPMVQDDFDPNTDYTEEAKGVVGVWRDAQKPQSPQNPVIGSKEWQDAERFKASLRPVPEGPAPQIISATTPNPDGTPGTPKYFRVPKAGGAATEIEGIAPKPTGTSGVSGSQQAQQARLLAAVSEARLADERMRAFEEDLLSGKATINPLQQAGGSLTSNLSASHSVPGAMTQAVSEYFLNKKSPDYAQYLRDASTIGRAEQMMSPRGGNETMVRANALLSRAGTGAMSNTIQASRMARQALFGASGGIEQTLTPGQSTKLQQGVERIKAGEHGNFAHVTPQAAGDINLGAPRAAATPQQIERAKTDPLYAQFLRETGKMP